MTDTIKNLPLEDLLELCADRTLPLFQAGWTELVHRYKNYIAAIVHKKYSTWSKNQNNVDLSDVINDIISNVFLVLFENNCSVLKQFKARTSEKAFCGYLATIANRLAIRGFRKFFMAGFIYSVVEIKEEEKNEDLTWWQLYDYIVSKLRKSAGKNQKFIERDILIFNLYIQEDFSRDMVESTPLLKGIGHRVVDNAVTRCKEKLNDADKNILRELLL